MSLRLLMDGILDARQHAAALAYGAPPAPVRAVGRADEVLARRCWVRLKSAPVDAAERALIVPAMSQMNEFQQHMMKSLFDAYGDDEIAVCDAYAEAERAGKVARPDEDRGEFAESYAKGLWRIGKAEGWLA